MSTVNSINCPNCGATLSVENEDAMIRCVHCGVSVNIDSSVSESDRIVKHMTAAQAKESDNTTIVRMKELELQEKKDKRKHGYILTIGAVVAICLCVGGYFGYDYLSKIPMPSSSAEYVGKMYQEVLTELEKAGFTNIEVKTISDLVTGWVTKDGTVETVVVNGDPSFETGSKFDKDVEIVVTYHTMSEDDESGSIKDKATDIINKGKEVVNTLKDGVTAKFSN